MSFPTDGYTSVKVRYSVTAITSSGHVNFSVVLDGDIPADEELVAGYVESALQSFKSDYELNESNSVSISRSYSGSQTAAL